MLSSDVNIIFIADDVTDHRHTKVNLYLKINKRMKYILLASVKKSFMYTYSDYFKRVGYQYLFPFSHLSPNFLFTRRKALYKFWSAFELIFNGIIIRFF